MPGVVVLVMPLASLSRGNCGVKLAATVSHSNELGLSLENRGVRDGMPTFRQSLAFGFIA